MRRFVRGLRAGVKAGLTDKKSLNTLMFLGSRIGIAVAVIGLIVYVLGSGPVKLGS
jgi:hypothetical protein